tara:strand:- start:63991 stop:64791 length:801 start_codon:yes stop_codon:yes gene_type:complete
MINLPHRQRGLSLIELMIAMVLGLLLIAGALQMMLTSQTIHQTTDTLSRIQENGRFALSFLTKSTRMGGYNSSEDEATEGKVFWDGVCDTSGPCTNNGAGNASDQIGVLLDPSNDSDCIGNPVGEEDKVIVNVYSIDGSPDNNQINSLYCQGFDPVTNLPYGAKQPLVDGVENMQVLYGVSDPAASNAITSYISADGVTDWASIGAVRISLLVNNGQVEGSGNSETRTFKLLDAPTISATDRHERQVYTTTTAITNIIYQSQDFNQ